MKVSVIIPVFNEEKYIKSCLDSLISQEEKPDEIIVIDNNSTDRTIDIVKKYPQVKVINEKKQGIAYARNAGFNAATGDILVKCDADSRFPINFIKNIKKKFSDSNSIVGLSMPLLVYDLPGASKSLFPFYLYVLIPRLIMGFYPLLTCYAIKKNAWEKIKKEVCLDDKKIHEDIDLSFHIKKVGKILHDSKTILMTSGRRIKYNPKSFFIEYTLIFFKMLKNHSS